MLAGAIAAVAWSAPLHAAFEFVPYLSTRYEYNSNIFEVTGHEEAREQNGDPRMSEQVLAYLAGFTTRWQASEQVLHLMAEGQRLTYQHFGRLDHNEYEYFGGYDWKIASVLDGALDYRQQRHLASFSDLDTTQLSLQTERIGNATVNLQLTPTWRLETGGQERRSALPLPESPHFELREASGSAALKYLGVSNLSAGVLARYTDGEYAGSLEASDFDEWLVAGTADYEVSGLSRFSLSVGATRREADDLAGGSDSISGFSGALAYSRTISAKTRASLSVFRRLDSYTAGANALVDSGVDLDLSWKPGEKLDLELRYGWLRSDFRTDSDTASQARRDDLQTARLDLNYRPWSYLLLRPYLQYRHRTSTIGDEAFDATAAGLELRASFE